MTKINALAVEFGASTDYMVSIFCEEMLELHRGQGLELWWRQNAVCPTVDEYLLMAERSKNSRAWLIMSIDFSIQRRDRGTASHVRSTVDEPSPRPSRPDPCWYYCQHWIALPNSGRLHKPDFYKFSGQERVRGRPDGGQILVPDHTLFRAWKWLWSFGWVSILILSKHLWTFCTDIVRQRPEEVEIKKQAIEIIRRTGSLNYTYECLRERENQLKDAIVAIGGSPGLERFVAQLSVDNVVVE